MLSPGNKKQIFKLSSLHNRQFVRFPREVFRKSGCRGGSQRKVKSRPAEVSVDQQNALAGLLYKYLRQVGRDEGLAVSRGCACNQDRPQRLHIAEPIEPRAKCAKLFSPQCIGILTKEKHSPGIGVPLDPAVLG